MLSEAFMIDDHIMEFIMFDETPSGMIQVHEVLVRLATSHKRPFSVLVDLGKGTKVTNFEIQAYTEILRMGIIDFIAAYDAPTPLRAIGSMICKVAGIRQFKFFTSRAEAEAWLKIQNTSYLESTPAQ